MIEIILVFSSYLIILFCVQNIFLKVIFNDIFYKYKNIFLLICSLLFALFIKNIDYKIANYIFIYFTICCVLFLIFLLFLLIFTKRIYTQYLANIIEAWEFICFMPLYFSLIFIMMFFTKISDFVDIFIIFLSFAIFYKSTINAINKPTIKHINIKNSKIKNELNIALVSDIHLKANLNKDFFEKIIKQLNDLNADAIVIAGDLIDTNIKKIDYLHLLNKLKAKYSTFYVLGNHEYYHNVSLIYKILKQYNINILNNKSIHFDDFTISGINDLIGEKFKKFKPDLSKLSYDENKFNILISHQPKIAKKYDLSNFDLILAGHTHAGQIFPFNFFVKLEQGYLHGLYKIKNSLMYVSSGAGFWGASARLLAPSEIVLIKISKD